MIDYQPFQENRLRKITGIALIPIDIYYLTFLMLEESELLQEVPVGLFREEWPTTLPINTRL
jgi:hypothetical protein